MFIYCFIFIIMAIVAIEYEIKPPQQTNLILVVICSLLILFAGLRGVYVSRDYLPYLGSFSAIMHGDAKGGSGVLPLFEPAFVWIVIACHRIFENNPAPAVMFVFAIVSISLKTLAIKRLSINPFLVFLLYYSHYFFIQEMTQIRNGMACSLFFLALYFHLRGSTINVVVVIFFAFLFHNSAILYFLLLLINKDRLNGYLYAVLLVLAVVFGLLKIPFLSMITGVDLNQISNKLTTYVDLAGDGDYEIRFFNVLNTINFLVTAYILGYCMWYKVTDKKLILFLKCNIVSLFSYGLLMNVPSMAARFSELFGATFPFLLAYGMQTFPFKKFNIVVIILIAAAYIYINLFYGELMMPYEIYKFR